MKEKKYMSKEYTNCLRGIFAILVVIHHLYQYTGLFEGTLIGAILQLFGFVSVAIFFFFSGYGLMFSTTKNNYVNQFFKKRFLPLYCFYVILIIIYSLWTLLIEKNISFNLIFRSFFFGETIVTNGWYLQTTFVTYLLYLLVFKNFNSSKIRLFVYGIGIFAYCVICIALNYGIFWYQTIPCLVLGMIYCFKKNHIDIILKKYVWYIFILCSISFAICFILSVFSEIKILFDILYSLFFVCTTVALAYLLCNTSLIENKFTKLCGNYSLEIYVAHGLFLRLIKYINNIYIYILTVIIGTIVSAVILKKIYGKITLLFQKKEISYQKDV